jgi:hypothetical protein
MVPRTLNENTFMRDQKMTVPKSECTNCSSKKPIPIPHPEDVPQALRGLTPEAARALSPLEIHVSRELRAQEGGYRVKMQMASVGVQSLSHARQQRYQQINVSTRRQLTTTCATQRIQLIPNS